MKKKPPIRIPSLPIPSSSPPLPLSSSQDDIVPELMMDPALPTDLIIDILSRLPVKSLGHSFFQRSNSLRILALLTNDAILWNQAHINCTIYMLNHQFVQKQMLQKDTTLFLED